MKRRERGSTPCCVHIERMLTVHRLHEERTKRVDFRGYERAVFIDNRLFISRIIFVTVMEVSVMNS